MSKATSECTSRKCHYGEPTCEFDLILVIQWWNWTIGTEWVEFTDVPICITGKKTCAEIHIFLGENQPIQFIWNIFTHVIHTNCSYLIIWCVVTKRRNDLKPPKTTYNHLQPSTTTSKNSTTTYNHLKNIYNHQQTIEYHLKRVINVWNKRDDNMSRKWNSRSVQHFNLPLESYSPWSPCTTNYGLKLRNEMCDHSIYILYSLSSKDSQRTLPKSSVRPVVNLSRAPKLFLRGLNSINPAKTVRKFLGTEGFS